MNRQINMKKFQLFFVCFLFSTSAISVEPIKTTTQGYFKPMGPGSDFWPFLPDSYPGFGTLEQQNSPQSNPDVFCQQQGEGWRLVSAGDISNLGRTINLGFPNDVNKLNTGNILPAHPTNYYGPPLVEENRIPLLIGMPLKEKFGEILGTLQDRQLNNVTALSLKTALIPVGYGVSGGYGAFLNGGGIIWLAEVSPQLGLRLFYNLQRGTMDIADLKRDTSSRLAVCVKDLQ